jgi:hypothetical protein
MQLKRSGRLGLVLISISLVTVACWTVWSYTRSWRPVDMPLSLRRGNHVSTGQFAVNLDSEYEIAVDAENKIPVDSLQCLLGSMFPPKLCQTSPVLKVHWRLSSDGMTVEGTSDDTVGAGSAGPDGEASRTIGLFTGQKDRKYQIDLDVLADGSSLAATNPHLRVSALSSTYESNLVAGGLLRLICVSIGVVGIVLLLLSLRASETPKSR